MEKQIIEGHGSDYHFHIYIHANERHMSCKIYKRNNKHTGRVVCPASSIMHTSNLMLASKGLEMPRQVTATTLTCSNLILTSSTLRTFVAVIETSVKRFLYKYYDRLKGRVLVINWQTWEAVPSDLFIHCFMSSNTYKINALHHLYYNDMQYKL